MADNLVLGRGKLFFTPYAPGETTGGTPGYFGNTPSLGLAQTNTKLDHYSSEGGLKVKDKSVLLQTDVTLTFDTDNINFGNLILWFGGANAGTLPADAPTGVGTLAFIGKADAIYGSLMYKSDNPVGDNVNYWFPYVNLTPNGTFALKGDTWQTLSFTCECLKRDAATERFYAYTPTTPAGDAFGDTTPTFTPATASVATSGVDIASGGTVTVPATGTVNTPFTASYTLTGGDTAYAVLHNGTANVGTPKLISGATGTTQFTATTTGAKTVKITSDPAGATVLATSGTITIS